MQCWQILAVVWLLVLLMAWRAGRRTTGGKNFKVDRSAVRLRGFTTQAILQSQQLRTRHEIETGPVAQDSSCAHPQGFRLQSVSYQNAPKHEPKTATLECPCCHVSWWFDKMPVRDAAWIQSTSPRPDSTQSAQGWTPAASSSISLHEAREMAIAATMRAEQRDRDAVEAEAGFDDG